MITVYFDSGNFIHLNTSLEAKKEDIEDVINNNENFMHLVGTGFNDTIINIDRITHIDDNPI